ncbi:MAG: serine hydrolase [Planctomycetota bacterium]
MKRICLFAVVLLLALVCVVHAGTRYPGETWLMYATPEEAGFSAKKLEKAKKYWESIPSAAAMVVYDGAVVTAWGDIERRFLLHSARKSLMSGLYGIHVDAGSIDVSKTLKQLRINDKNPRLNAKEKKAKIIDLLRARSGVYHLAAAESSQTPKPARGAYAPGTHWCYNNWDFNALCTIIEQETGIKVFEEFDKRFADPLAMQDYRPRDGIYQFERDKSIHPAYHFRMSARDMARFGLLYLRKGDWAGNRILSESWIEESTRSHSDASDSSGYGYMWWVPLDAPFKKHGMYSARGVGEQSIDVLPGADMVFVNRTNTYDGKTVTYRQRKNLLKKILAAKTGDAKTDPQLVPLPSVPRPFETVQLTDQQKKSLCSAPADESTGRIVMTDGELVFETPDGASYGLIPVAGDQLIVDDRYTELFWERNDDGTVARIITESSLNHEGYGLLHADKVDQAIAVFKKAVEYYPGSYNVYDSLGEAYMVKGERDLAIQNYRKTLQINPDNRGAVRMLERLGALSESASAKQSPIELPGTKAGRCAAAFFEMFNSGDDDKVRDFENRHRAKSALEKRPMEDRVRQIRELRVEFRTLKPVYVLSSTEYELTLAVRASATDKAMEFYFELEEDRPHSLLAISISGP